MQTDLDALAARVEAGEHTDDLDRALAEASYKHRIPVPEYGPVNYDPEMWLIRHGDDYWFCDNDRTALAAALRARVQS